MKRPPVYARPLLLGMSFAGFVVALYLTFMHYRGAIPRCYIFKECDVVQTSTYSAVFGVPVALLGTLFFVVMFYLGIALLTRYGPKLAIAYRALAYLGALVVIPLFLLQAIVLRAFCVYCLTTEILMLSMWVLSFVLPVHLAARAPAPTSGGKRTPTPAHPPRRRR